MRTIAAEIERQLIPLIGLPLSLTHRVADLRIFQFGDIKMVDGGAIGRYAIHIQCPWRIEHDNRIVSGQTDLWEPFDPDAVVDWSAWRYDRDANLQDSLLNALISKHDPGNQVLSNATYQLIVETVQADDYGGAIISFTHNYRLVIFPAGSRGEDWRLFQPGTNTLHFVIAGGTIESLNAA